MKAPRHRLAVIAFSAGLSLSGGLHAHPGVDGPQAEDAEQIAAKPFASITEKNGQRIIESN